jgi:phosphate acyltransferase
MFLGLAGIAVKSHGSTDAFGFANAIGVAVDLKLNGFLPKIIDDLARLNAAAPTPVPAGAALAPPPDGVVTASL